MDQVLKMLFGIHVHRTELNHLEGLTAFAQPLLQKERRAVWIVKPNSESNDQMKRKQANNHREAKRDVKQALEGTVRNPAIYTTSNALQLCLGKPPMRIGNRNLFGQSGCRALLGNPPAIHKRHTAFVT